MSERTKHILVIRLSAMGDVAMVVPVLRALTAQYKDLRFTVLTKALFKPFFRDLNNVDLFHADIYGAHKGVFGLYKLAKSLEKGNFDGVADLHNVLRSKVLKRFVNHKKWMVIDKGRTEKRALVSGQKFEQLKTTHQRYADVFEKLGFPIELSQPNFPSKAALSNRLKAFLGNPKLKCIGIAPFAAHKGKMYPLEMMKEVIQQVSQSHAVILFGGGEKEVALLSDFEHISENVKNVAGKLTLDEELDIISNLDLMLSMDSSNGHMAAMLGIKVVTLWGVTHPYAGFAPFNQPEANYLMADRTRYPKIPTSIYGNKHVEGYNDAIRSIAPSEVITKIEGLIK